MSSPQPPSYGVVIAAVSMEGAVSKKGTRGKPTQATEFSQEFSLELVEAFENAGGPPSGVVTTQFSIFELDTIQIPCIFGPNSL